MSTKFLPALAAAVAVTGGVALADSASAATFNFSITLPSTLTNSLPVPSANFSKFDTNGKTINSITLGLTGQLGGSVKFTNDTSNSLNVNFYQQNATLQVNGPTGSPLLIQAFPQQQIIPPTLTLPSNQSQLYNFNATASAGPSTISNGDWSLFATLGGGLGTVQWAGTANALISIDSGINVETAAALGGNLDVTIDYTDNPTPPQPPVTSIPEPSSLLGLVAIASIGGLATKSRKKS